jgi:hypothetical protein
VTTSWHSPSLLAFRLEQSRDQFLIGIDTEIGYGLAM